MKCIIFLPEKKSKPGWKRLPPANANTWRLKCGG
jgi:hypothetical protein